MLPLVLTKLSLPPLLPNTTEPVEPPLMVSAPPPLTYVLVELPPLYRSPTVLPKSRSVPDAPPVTVEWNACSGLTGLGAGEGSAIDLMVLPWLSAVRSDTLPPMNTLLPVPWLNTTPALANTVALAVPPLMVDTPTVP